MSTQPFRYSNTFIARDQIGCPQVSALAKRDKYGHVIGFYAAPNSMPYDILRWIRRDDVQGNACEIAVCVVHRFNGVQS